MNLNRLILLTTSTFLLAACSDNNQNEVNSTLKTSLDSTAETVEDDFNLNYVKSEVDYLLFTMKNNTETQYQHILSDEEIYQFVNKSWEKLNYTKSLLHLVSFIEPNSSEDFLIPKSYFENKSGQFKPICHLKNDSIGEKYVETIFDFN